MTTTIILPISRKHYLKEVFTNLEFLECDRGSTTLITYTDGPHHLYDLARNFTLNSKFEKRIALFRGKGEGSIGSVRRRRQRIADIHNEIRQIITSDEKLNRSGYYFLIEDDGLLPTDALGKLYSHYMNHSYAGMITGIELGRWGYLHIGAWEFDDIYTPKIIISPELKTGLKKIDGAGLYCTLTKAEYYLRHTFKPFEDVLGPDTEYGLSLRQKGFLNFIDYSIHVSHLTQGAKIEVSKSSIVRVKLEKNDNERLGWNQGIYE